MCSGEELDWLAMDVGQPSPQRQAGALTGPASNAINSTLWFSCVVRMLGDKNLFKNAALLTL